MVLKPMLKKDQSHLQKKVERPQYNGELPEGNDGLGLMLLGVTGDQVLDKDVYKEIKAVNIKTSSWNCSGRHSKRRSGPKYMYIFYGIALRLMGDVQEYFIDKGVRNFYSALFRDIISQKLVQIQLPSLLLPWQMDLLM